MWFSMRHGGSIVKRLLDSGDAPRGSAMKRPAKVPVLPGGSILRQPPIDTLKVW
jgi:hypothetical protein